MLHYTPHWCSTWCSRSPLPSPRWGEAPPRGYGLFCWVLRFTAQAGPRSPLRPASSPHPAKKPVAAAHPKIGLTVFIGYRSVDRKAHLSCTYLIRGKNRFLFLPFIILTDDFFWYLMNIFHFLFYYLYGVAAGARSHALRLVVWPCAAISLWGPAPIPRSQLVPKKKVAYSPPSSILFLSRSSRIKLLMYLPLFTCFPRYSSRSLSSLKDIIFWVMRPVRLSPFLISSFFISIRLFHNLMNNCLGC